MEVLVMDNTETVGSKGCSMASCSMAWLGTGMDCTVMYWSAEVYWDTVENWGTLCTCAAAVAVSTSLVLGVVETWS